MASDSLLSMSQRQRRAMREADIANVAKATQQLVAHVSNRADSIVQHRHLQQSPEQPLPHVQHPPVAWMRCSPWDAQVGRMQPKIEVDPSLAVTDSLHELFLEVLLASAQARMRVFKLPTPERLAWPEEEHEEHVLDAAYQCAKTAASAQQGDCLPAAAAVNVAAEALVDPGITNNNATVAAKRRVSRAAPGLTISKRGSNRAANTFIGKHAAGIPKLGRFPDRPITTTAERGLHSYCLPLGRAQAG
eukprot:358813-Chlamydomonas_euryale.AAC.5